MQIRVAAAQIPVTNDVEANLAQVLRAVDFAAAEDADILLTPEGSLSGYTHEFDQRAVEEVLPRVIEKATAAGVGLALGTCFVEPEDGRCYNQVRFYRPNGDYLGFHSKTLLCGSLADPPEGEINHYAVRPLQTFDVEGVPAGALICNDLWANPSCTPMPDPHLSQQLSGMGARIVFHAVNGGRDASEWPKVTWQYHESNLQMRARAGGLWVVTADNCHPSHLRCSSPSGVVSPDGQWACRAEPLGRRFLAHTIPLPDRHTT